MKNVLVAALLCASLAAQGPPVFWPEGHPPETHTHTNGNGHHGEHSDGHGGWGFGHHKIHEGPCTEENCTPCEEPGCNGNPCEPGGGSAPVPEPTTLILTGIGLATAAMASRKRKKTEEVQQA